MRLRAAAAALLGCLLAAPAAPAPPAEAAAAADPAAAPVALGRQIYQRGVGAGGREIPAAISGGGMEVPASVLPCVGCHGEDGRGRAEGGVSPSDLTWEALTKPYGVRHASGREHPPYDERSLVWAITTGADPGGNALGDAMPRYRLTADEASALVAFLRQLDRSPEPGVSDSAVRLGVVLPPPELRSVGEAVGAALQALVAAYNRDGGVYGRRLELRFAAPSGSPAERRAAVAKLLDDEPFALVAGFIAGADAEIASLAAERKVPLVGPFTLDPQVALPLNRYVFYLISGLEQQARALVDFAATQPDEAPAARVAVVYPGDPVSQRLAAAIADQGRRDDLSGAWGSVAAVPYASGKLDAEAVARAQLAAGTDVAFLLGPEADAGALLQAAATVGWRPRFYLPGALAGGLGTGLPAATAERVFLSAPVIAADRRSWALERFRKLTLPPDAGPGHQPMQLAAVAAAEVLVEGMRRAGRDLTRERLIDTLEHLYDYDTGLLPPITYGPARRVGALGAYILAYDGSRRSFSPTGEWVTPR